MVNQSTRGNGFLPATRDIGLSSRRIIRILERVIVERGMPVSIRTDNGPEFTSHHFEGWCREKQIDIQFIQPGEPM